MVELLRDVMGPAVEFAEPTTTELSIPSESRVQVFAPGNPCFDFFRRETSGPIALFEVDDIRAAHATLSAAGVEMSALSKTDEQLGVAALPRARQKFSTNLPAVTQTQVDLHRQGTA